MTLHTLSPPFKRIRFSSMLRYVLTRLRVVLDSPHLLHVQLQLPLQELLPQISRVEKKLSNEKFVAKAPAAVVEAERAKGADYQAQREAVLERIATLKKI